MNKRQKAVEKKKLTEEEKILKNLKKQYMRAADDVAKTIKIQTGRIDSLLSDFDNLSDEDKSILRSMAYRREFQETLKQQIDSVLDVLNSTQHKDIDEYLKMCYELGFVGSMFDLHGQVIPLILPIDNKAAAKAVKLDPKLSTKLYGTYTRHLKTHIRNEISRGIMTGDSYGNIARNIANRSNQGFNRAMTIVRTEGHRIHMESSFDAMNQAKDSGADVVKQWNAQLDGKTRKTHRKLDGQIRELDEPFEVDGKKVMYPSKFGRPEEDINCRCTINQRAKWMLDDDELETLKERADYFKLDKTDDFDDFKKKYLKASKVVDNFGESGKIITGATSGAYNDENDPYYKKRDAHAERYYTAIKNGSKAAVVNAISENAGISSKDVSAMYDHLFVNEYDLGDGQKQFDADYHIAQSIQRLRDGKDIQEHDLVLVKHEAMEHDLMNNEGLSYRQAHEIANKSYNYQEALEKWLSNRK